MINNITSVPVKKLCSQTGTVYLPKEGWSYSHHASITFYKGRFWAIWSNGKVDEDSCGQRVMLAESADGLHWEKLRPVVTPGMLGDENAVLTAAGFHVHEDALNVYFGYYRYARNDPDRAEGQRPAGDVCHEGTELGVVTTRDGENWSAPRLLGLPIVPNHGPEKTRSGRLIISGNIMFPYTDDPDGLDGYRLTGIYGDSFKKEWLRDDSESIQHVTKAQGWDAKLICEGSFFQTKDSILHMMLRSNTAYLWHSESRDDGETWTDPEKTGYTDAGSKFHFGSLPDGRVYGVSNTEPGSNRIPLCICLSEDGENFGRRYILRDEDHQLRFKGMHKGGVYGYPHTFIHDGFMYVIYSINKEGVEVTKFALEQLTL